MILFNKEERWILADEGEKKWAQEAPGKCCLWRMFEVTTACSMRY
jgi:hypothetical protein